MKRRQLTHRTAVHTWRARAPPADGIQGTEAPGWEARRTDWDWGATAVAVALRLWMGPCCCGCEYGAQTIYLSTQSGRAAA
jgi:hypothetical protein